MLGLLAMVCTMAVWFAAPSPAMAQATTTTPPTKCSEYVGVTNRIVTCVRETIEAVSYKYYDQFYPYVQGMIAGFLTLSVIIYGIMASFGMLEKIGRDTFVLMIKLACITFFITNTDFMYENMVKAMDAAGESVVEFTPDSGPLTDQTNADNATCLKRMKEAIGATDSKNFSPPWLAVDCMIDSVIGIKVPTNGDGTTPTKGAPDKWFNDNLDKEGLSRGVIGFFFSTLQSSVMGFMFAVIGFFFVYSLVWLIAKALFVYLAAYIALAFMVIFAPIFIPLILFRPTKEYFTKWAKLVISFMLQPIIILVFISFTIAAIDLALFTGDYSVMYRIAGDASRQKGFNLNKYLEEKEISKKVPSAPVQVRTGRTSADKLEKTVGSIFNDSTWIDCSKKVMDGDPKAKAACSQSYPVQVWRDSIDWKKLAEVRTPAVTPSGADVTPGQQISREVIAALLFAAVVVFIMNGLMRVVPNIVNDLLGDSFQSPNLFGAVSRNSGMGGLDQISQNISNRIRGTGIVR